MSKKTGALLIMLLIVVAGAVGAYFFVEEQAESPAGGETAIDTSEWATYRNVQNGYELKYQNGVILRNGETNTVLVLDDFFSVPQHLKNELKNTGLSKDGYFLSMSVSVHEVSNPGNLSIADWINTERADIVNGAVSRKDGVFIGIPAVFLENSLGLNGVYSYKQATVYFFHKGNLFSIRSIARPQNPSEEWRAHRYYQYLEKSVPITQAIIDSFRFVE